MMVLFVLLQVGDLVTSVLGGVQYETNPFAAMVWIRYGFGMVVLGKSFCCVFTYLVARLIHRVYPRLAVDYLGLLNLFCTFVLVGNLHFLASL